MRHAWALLTASMLTACDGAILEPSWPAPSPGAQPVHVACDSVARASDLDGIAADFAAEVHPGLVRSDNGCIGCHADGSGRSFVVLADARETFFRTRSGGFFLDKPGSLVDRLTNPDPAARMPKGGRWQPSEIETLERIACQVRALGSAGGPAADEEFPPNLLTAWAGPKPDTYENSFINYRQLKGRVKQVFNDDWVRGGQDRFAASIASFGGADFTTTFTEAKVATPEFLLGLDALAPDVCSKAVADRTGPFASLDTAALIIDQPPSVTTVFEAEAATVIKTPTGSGSAQGTAWKCTGNCRLATTVTLAGPGTFQVVVRAKAIVDSEGNGPKLQVTLAGEDLGRAIYTDTVNFSEKTFTATLSAGTHALNIDFTNDFSDPALPAGSFRDVVIDGFRVIGPAGVSTGTQRADAAKVAVGQVFSRMLYRQPSTAERDDLYAVLRAIATFSTPADSWAAACEALMRHPDFLWTLPPSHATSSGADRARLQLVKLANDLLGRPPTAAELQSLDSGQTTYPQLVDQYLASVEFRDYLFSRIRLRTESNGQPVGDEPARLWAYLAMNDRPFFELLTGDYSVDESYQRQPRPAEHGKSGLLTMKGFIVNKQGLPHYNYAARVMTDFLGYSFEIPIEVFEQRNTSTASSTVDPKSICFTCHQNLTPLSHQRLKWSDEGDYRATDSSGQPLDDSDQGMVASYGFKGVGIEAFGAAAVRKESFIRHTLNAHFGMMFGRDLRHTQDERGLYKQLWDVTAQTHGNLRAVLKTIALSDAYLRN